MSPAKKRTTKGTRKTRKKATRKTTAKKAAEAKSRKKATPKVAKKSAKRDTAKSPAAKKGKTRKAPVEPPQASETPAAKPPEPAAAKVSQATPRLRVAQPLESAEKKPALGAKWACFNCGAKFYDLNRPAPICPKCQADQREQPAKPAEPPPTPTARRPAAAPISRLLDEEEASEATFEDDADAEEAAELDIGKLEGDVDYLDDADFDEETDD